MGQVSGYGGTGGFDPYDTPANGFGFNVPPSYQLSYLPETATYNYRLVPDVASLAGGQNGLGQESYPYPGWALEIYYNNPPNEPLGTSILIDGTSIASPATAGSLGGLYSAIFANVIPNANRSNVRFGLLQPFIYSQGANASAVTDITAGISSGNLPGTSTPTPPGPGWDFATGWGSLNFAGLLDYTTYDTHLAVLHPSSVTAGSAGIILELTGTGFVQGQSVLWNGTPIPTTFVNADELQAALPANLFATASSDTISVSSSLTPTLGPNTDTRQFNVDNPVPAVNSVSPTTALVYGPTYTITVYGSNFVSNSTVKWGNVGLPTTFISAGELQASVSSKYLTAAETATITVANAKPGGGYSNGASVAVKNPVPTASSVSPATAILHGPSYTITVYGTNFLPTSTVKWSGKGLPTTFVSSTELQATVGSQFLANPKGPGTITVVSPVPGGGVSDGVSVPFN